MLVLAFAQAVVVPEAGWEEFAHLRKIVEKSKKKRSSPRGKRNPKTVVTKKRRRELHILQWNVEGLFSARTRSISGLDNPSNDILLLQETFHVRPAEIPGFTVVEELAIKTRGRPSGGILTAVRTSIECEYVEKNINLVHVKLTDHDLSIINCYFTPNTEVDDILESIGETVGASTAGKYFIIAGDFNCRTDSALSDRGRTLEEGLAQLGFILVTDPELASFVSPQPSGLIRKSAIDHVFTNVEHLLISCRHEVEEEAQWNRPHRQVRSMWRIRTGNCGVVFRGRSRDVDVSALAHQAGRIEKRVSSLLTRGLVDRAVAAINESILETTTEKKRTKEYFNRWFDKKCKNAKKLVMDLRSAGHPGFRRASKEYHRLCRRKKAEYDEGTLLKKLQKAEVNPFFADEIQTGSCIYLYPWTESRGAFWESAQEQGWRVRSRVTFNNR
ncbi:hypothetical protein TYRP_017146 [Tyrophagus putrescentiae]|nr:hypothetical protein TYRP_017146 [Tyrophagus putrescentiae]